MPAEALGRATLVMYGELGIHPDPTFTKTFAPRLASPFVVVDVGVYGGANPRWRALGAALRIYGFDAREEAIAPLRRIPLGAGQSFYTAAAIGDEDGECEFAVHTVNPAESSFYSGSDTVMHRRVPIHRLDTLVGNGAVAKPDVLKIDVEGYEKHVFLGATQSLENSILAVEFESSFGASWVYPNTHFGTALDILTPRGFRLVDIAFYRHMKRPTTINTLFCRELHDGSSTDEILKTVMIHELYDFGELAAHLLQRFGNVLSLSIDVGSALNCLKSGWGGQTAFEGDPLDEIARLRAELGAIRNSNSWRITAPLRALKDRMK
jgi:FkbM family methyltransferase